jgi:hypothetical protein
MDGWTIAADMATVLTGLSVLTATFVWVRRQVRDWKQERAKISLRNWHAYIAPERREEWFVRLAEGTRDQMLTGRVVLEVLDRYDGEPDAGWAHRMQQVVMADGMLSRAPTPEEFDFLVAQRKARHQTGFPVGSDQLVPAGMPFTRFTRWPPQQPADERS